MERIVPVRIHVTVWLVLLALTGINIALTQLKFGPVASVANLVLAAIQAVLVAMFLMHLRWSSTLVRLFAMAGLVWMCILIAGTMDDVLTRGWLPIPGK
jgi:cytochrome c oxidase subunit IV